MIRKKGFIYMLLLALFFSSGASVKAIDYDDVKEKYAEGLIENPLSWYKSRTESPVIVDYRVNKNTIKKGEILEINLKLREKGQIESNYISLAYKNKTSGNIMNFSLESKDGINYKSRDRISGFVYEDGDYILDKVITRDIAGNKLVFAKGVKSPVIKLRNMDIKPMKPVKLLSIEAKDTLGNKNKARIEAKVARPMKEGSMLKVILRDKENNWPMEIDLTRDKTDKTKYSGYVSIDQYWANRRPPNGIYRVDRNNERGKLLRIYNKDNGSLDVIADKSLIEKPLRVKSSLDIDSKAPVLSKVELKEKNLRRGEVLDFTLKLREKDKLNGFVVYYEAPKSKALYPIRLFNSMEEIKDSFNMRFYLEGYMEPGVYKYVYHWGIDENGNEMKTEKTVSFPDFTILKDDNRPVFPDYQDRKEDEAKMVKTYFAKKDLAIEEFTSSKKTSSLKTGERIRAVEDGSDLVFSKNDKFYKISKKDANAYGKKVTFISKGVNVRNSQGEKIGNLKFGRSIVGKDLGSRIEFTFDNQKAYVTRKFVEEDGISRSYRSKGVNVRDESGEKLGYLGAGEKIYGRRDGEYIHFIYKNKPSKAHSMYLY